MLDLKREDRVSAQNETVKFMTLVISLSRDGKKK